MGIFNHIFQKKKSTENTFNWNDELWDMHCHILPEVDDGSDSMEESMEMIRLEIAEGVTDILLTPHYIIGETDADKISQQYELLCQKVKEEQLPIRLYLGNELFYSIDLEEHLAAGRARTLSGSRFVLVEFMPDTPYKMIQRGLYHLKNMGYDPVLAHLERYIELKESVDRVDELVSHGILIQANTNSFLRKSTSKFLFRLLERNLIHMIGTDAHGAEWRPPKMREAIAEISKVYNEDDLRRLLIPKTVTKEFR